MTTELQKDDSQTNFWRVTGQTLVGGANLTYTVAKDLYEHFKTKEKVIYQVIDSCFDHKHHLLHIRIVSAYTHSLYIESIKVDEVKHSSLELYNGYERGIKFEVRNEGHYWHGVYIKPLSYHEMFAKNHTLLQLPYFFCLTEHWMNF